MMLIMSIVCLLLTLDRYIRLAESLHSVNYVQPYMFQILEENLYNNGPFYEISVILWLVLGDVWLVSVGFRWFQVVPGRSFLILVSTFLHS